ncbi:MAG TPA: hypothetical protein VEA69_10740 [Tepidisphaeraceae bacterium]|nr:hypothetical protein [Tepidisphaeraceae bacterium]
MTPTRLSLLLTLLLTAPTLAADPPGVTRHPVVFTGGHDTDPVDRGRPVVLIAAALNVTPDVFRDAFSRVRPAGPGRGGPTDAQARQNKAALMAALGKHGVTNDRLDQVSNYYRYPPGGRDLWKHRPATAVALVKGNAIIAYEITDPGAGYTTPPTVTIPTLKAPPAPTVKLHFGQDLATNGSVASIAKPAAKE